MISSLSSHLRQLEAEAIYVLREVMARFERPALLFSGGKDSLLCFHLARKAAYPGRIPFPLVHIDTGHNFPETIRFRDDLVARYGVKLLVGSVQESIDKGRVVEETGLHASRNALQTTTLLDTIAHYGFDACIGGGRRDEEKARAKERFFSHRDEFGQWQPKAQRPELWNLYNSEHHEGESFRVFPISNWTELDVWQYILAEGLELPPLYFAHERSVFERNQVLYNDSPLIQRKPTEVPATKRVRFRTIGDMTCTGAVESEADTLEKIIEEVSATRTTERGTRIDDQRSEAAMEERKTQGYF